MADKQIVSLSGGKDSTCMLLMMLERGEQIDDIVFFDWGMEFPEMYEHLLKLEDYIKRPITRLYPKRSFEYWMFEHIITKGKREGARGCGWAYNKVNRWCTREKIRTLTRFAEGRIECIGYDYDERFRRPRYYPNHRYPLLEWGVTNIEALKYCANYGFDWGGLYKYFKSVSCWCCPLQSKTSLIALKENFPNLWQKLLEMDSKSPFPHPKKELIERLKV